MLNIVFLPSRFAERCNLAEERVKVLETALLRANNNVLQKGVVIYGDVSYRCVLTFVFSFHICLDQAIATLEAKVFDREEQRYATESSRNEVSMRITVLQ